VTPWLILDVATAPVDNAADFIEADPSDAPSNYGPEAAQKWAEKERQKKLDRAGLDVDLARVTAIGAKGTLLTLDVLCTDESSERRHLEALGNDILDSKLITFNGHAFDLLVLQRRARYLGVKDFPVINTDRYKSHHVDLMDVLTHRGILARRSLGFYVKRLGWTDLVKPLSGSEEAQVPQTGKWDELRLSVQHDVEATYRLAKWLGVISNEKEETIF